MDVVKAEFSRNVSAYFLIIVGMLAMAYAHHISYEDMGKTGGILVSAALLAFQAKRSPDGNTTTTSVTVPPPAVAAPDAVIVPKV